MGVERSQMKNRVGYFAPKVVRNGEHGTVNACMMIAGLIIDEKR